MTDHAAPPPPRPGAAKEFASWGPRLLAYLIDAVPVVVVSVVITALFGETSSGDGAVAAQVNGFPALLMFALVFGWFIYNWLICQGRTGQTLGKKIMKMGVFAVGTRDPIGPGLTFARQLVHVVDGLPLLLGYLWPLWDKEKRTFADMIMGTRLYKD